jgi:hypothetical protein
MASFIFIVPVGTLRLLWLDVFPCFFLSCKANARVKPAKTGHGRHSSKTFVLFYVSFVLCRPVYCLRVCKCVLYYCHRVTTQLQLTNISYHSKITWKLGLHRRSADGENILPNYRNRTEPIFLNKTEMSVNEDEWTWWIVVMILRGESRSLQTET